MRGAAGKCDPSRGAARGTRVGGRGGRDDPRCCADGAPGRCGSTAGGRPCGRASSSRRGRGRMTRRRRTAGGTHGRSSYGAADPRRRSSQGDLRLDNEPQPWHKGTGRPALSELGAVTRVRWARPDPHPTTWSAGAVTYAVRTRKRGRTTWRPPYFGQPLGRGRSRACVRAASRSPCAPCCSRRRVAGPVAKHRMRQFAGSRLFPPGRRSSIQRAARRNGSRKTMFGEPILARFPRERLRAPRGGVWRPRPAGHALLS